MKKFAFVLACTALATPMVFAQAKSFEGLSMGANIGSAKTTVEDTTGVTPSSDGTTAGVDLNAQYNWAMGSDFVLGVGVSMGLGNNKAGTFGGTDINIKNRYALEFTPGFVVTKDVLVYGKIASLTATADGGGTTTDLSGVGYGLGVRAMVDKNMYWQVGYDLNQYQEKNNVKAKSSVLSLGVGYKF